MSFIGEILGKQEKRVQCAKAISDAEKQKDRHIRLDKRVKLVGPTTVDKLPQFCSIFRYA
jgi:hypothetical protein